MTNLRSKSGSREMSFGTSKTFHIELPCGCNGIETKFMRDNVRARFNRLMKDYKKAKELGMTHKIWVASSGAK